MSEPRIVTKTRAAVGHGGMYSASQVRAVISYFDGALEENERLERVTAAAIIFRNAVVQGWSDTPFIAARRDLDAAVAALHDPTLDRGEFRTYAEIRDEPGPADTEHEDTMAKVRQLTGQKEETE